MAYEDESEESKALSQREHNRDAGAKRTVVRAQDPVSGNWVNIAATDNGDGTFSLKTSAAVTFTRGASSATTQVGDSATVVTLKAANTSRVKLTVVNTSSAVLYVKEGSSATTSDWTYRLEQYDSAIIDDYSGIVTGIWSSDAGGVANVTETT